MKRSTQHEYRQRNLSVLLRLSGILINMIQSVFPVTLTSIGCLHDMTTISIRPFSCLSFIGSERDIDLTYQIRRVFSCIRAGNAMSRKSCQREIPELTHTVVDCKNKHELAWTKKTSWFVLSLILRCWRHLSPGTMLFSQVCGDDGNGGCGGCVSDGGSSTCCNRGRRSSTSNSYSNSGCSISRSVVAVEVRWSVSIHLKGIE